MAYFNAILANFVYKIPRVDQSVMRDVWRPYYNNVYMLFLSCFLTMSAVLRRRKLRIWLYGRDFDN